MAPFKIAFLGLGGVGGYFGAKLARTYSQSEEIEIVFLASEKTAEIIAKNGIRLTTPLEEFIAQPHLVTSNAGETGFVDLLIVSVKSYDLEEGLHEFKACIGPKTIILPLLNGIDAPGRIRNLFPETEVWSGCVYIVSRRIAPGVIEETGNIHSLWFGADDSKNEQLNRVYTILHKAHDGVFLSDEINKVIWEKFVFISPIASLTVALNKNIGQILSDPESKTQLSALLSEIVSLARKLQISLPQNIEELTLAKFHRLPSQTTSSMHSDFQNNRKTEVESLTGHVVQLARLHQAATPNFESIYSSIINRSKYE